MIIIADQKADIGRYVVVHNMLQRYPDETVCYLPQANLSHVGLTETIYILAHGGGGQVGRKTPAEMAAALVGRRLKSGAKIEIRACHAGEPAESLGGATFVDELARELRVNHSRTVHVVGYTGTGVVQEQGSYRAKDEELNDSQQEHIYDSIIDGGDKEIRAARSRAKEMEALHCSIPEIAAEVAELTRDVFAKLYEHNLSVLKSIDSGKHESSLAAYLKQLDPMWADSLILLDQIRREEHQRWSSSTPSYIV